MPDDVSSRILAAATLAEQAAKEIADVDGYDWTNARTVTARKSIIRDFRLAAPGPSHWGAVAAGFRALVAMHDRYWAACSVGEHHCRYGYLACESLSELLPLADQIIRDLGDG